MSDVIKLDNDNFKQEILEADLPGAVLFKSPSCPHCVKMEPVFEEVSQAHVGQMKFGIVDVSQGPEVAAEYGILSIPVVLLLKAGEEVDRITGFVSAEDLKAKIPGIL